MRIPATKQATKNLLRKFGYEIRKTNKQFYRLGYDLEDLADNAIQIVAPYTMLNRERLVTLYQQVAFCDKYSIQGDLVECGVWKGGSVALMALANLQESKTRRNIHLFDSFSEICAPDKDIDGARAISEVQKLARNPLTDGELVPLEGIYDRLDGPGTLEGNIELMEHIVGYPREFVHYHKGWFQDTLPASSARIEKIAVLRLDGDWYASTKICLDYLYDKVVPNGFVVIDDYGCYDGCRKAVDEFLEARGIAAFLSNVDADARYLIKPA